LCQCCSYCLSCKCCTNEQDQKVEQAEQMEKYNPEEEMLNLSRPLMSSMQNYNVEIGTDDISTSTVENTNNYMNNGASISQSETLELTQSHEKIDIVSNVAQDDDIVDDDESKLNEKINDELPDNRNISSNSFGLGAISKKKKKSKKNSTKVQKEIIIIEHGNDEPDDEIDSNDGHEDEKKPNLFSKLMNFLKRKKHNSDVDVEGKNWLPLKESDEKSQTSEVNEQQTGNAIETSEVNKQLTGNAIAETPEPQEKTEDETKTQISADLLLTLG